MSLLAEAKQFVADHIKAEFHDRRLARIEALKLDDVLKRKNPYLFKAKAVTSAPEMVRQILDANLSSSEETVFGEFLEKLAIFVCQRVYGGVKPATNGIDLDFTREGIRYLVSIKSGPNWANAPAKRRMLQDFGAARKIIGHKAALMFVNGCCYGRDAKPFKAKDNYLKLCGQDFWFLISNESNMYHEIVEPLGAKAKERNDEFNEAYGRALTRFTKAFTNSFCTEDGAINWPAIVDLTSRSKKLWQP
ncbi:PmeII family type II restriction endonuclease [Aquabacterium sp.]|uniref:PmeII family type II restriction endonuclease n=1 Tax=Aquabacterium sp. TaxID=1872578 RepID=UPI0035B4F616